MRFSSMGRAIGAGAVTLLLTLPLLLLLQLPAPASAAAGVVVGAIVRSPVVRQLGVSLMKQVASAGGEALIKKAFSSGSGSGSGSDNGKNQLGSAAAHNASYIVYNVSIAQQTFYGVLDIFNAFLWMPCPAEGIRYVPCQSQTCMTFLSGFSDANCDGSIVGGGYCLYSYGSPDSGGGADGYLAAETFTVGAGTIGGDVVFGCSSASTVAGQNMGAIGFNRGSLSILSQLGISRFSYFLTPVDSSNPVATSAVLLGAQAVPQTTHSRSTPLFASKAYPDLYYVQLTGIEVDGVPLTGVPAGAFDLAPDGESGGVVLSTTTPLTYLRANAYYALRQALASKIESEEVKSSNGLDLCYNTQSVAKLTFPKIALVFAGAGSPSMNLTTVHYFYKDGATGLQCLTMLPMPDYMQFGSILGSMLQAGTNMIYDTDAGKLTFENSVTAAATATVHSQVSLMLIASLLLVWVLLF